MFDMKRECRSRLQHCYKEQTQHPSFGLENVINDVHMYIWRNTYIDSYII